MKKRDRKKTANRGLECDNAFEMGDGQRMRRIGRKANREINEANFKMQDNQTHVSRTSRGLTVRVYKMVIFKSFFPI